MEIGITFHIIEKLRTQSKVAVLTFFNKEILSACGNSFWTLKFGGAYVGLKALINAW